MSEMVERVARAIYALNPMVKAMYPPIPIPWENANEEVRTAFRNFARAAIAAMRKPTDEMNNEGYTAACEHDYGDMVPALEIAPATWRAMIDAALADGQ